MTTAEQEQRVRADRTASHADADPAVTAPVDTLSDPLLRKALSDPLATAPGTLVGGGAGRPLPDDLRGSMESSFGEDFSSVRVHENAAPEALGDVAFTRGEEIHVTPGQLDPGSPAGRSLIAHELTHVVQQRQGLVPASASGGPPLQGFFGFGKKKKQETAPEEQVPTGSEYVVAKVIVEKIRERELPDLSKATAATAAEEAVNQTMGQRAGALAKKLVNREAQRIVRKTTQKGRSHKKVGGGTFKGESFAKAESKRKEIETTETDSSGKVTRYGSSRDTGRLLEKRAYVKAKKEGRAEALAQLTPLLLDDAALLAMSTLDSAVTTVATDGGLKSAATGAHDRVKDQVVLSVTRQAGPVVGQAIQDGENLDDPSHPAPVVEQAVQPPVVSLQNSLSAPDPMPRKTALKVAQRERKNVLKQLETAISQQLQAGAQANEQFGGDVAKAKGLETIEQTGEEFKALHKRIQERIEAQGGIKSKLTKLARLIDVAVPDPGDSTEIDLLLKIPVYTGVFVSFRFTGSAERAGGLADTATDMVTLKMELALGAGGEAGWGSAMGELGGYIESSAPKTEHALDQISYALYRRMRESDLIPRWVPNKIWGMGGKSGEGMDLGIAKGDMKRMEAEEWGATIERRMEKERSEGHESFIEAGGFVGAKGAVKVPKLPSTKGLDVEEDLEVGAKLFSGRLLRPEQIPEVHERIKALKAEIAQLEKQKKSALAAAKKANEPQSEIDLITQRFDNGPNGNDGIVAKKAELDRLEKDPTSWQMPWRETKGLTRRTKERKGRGVTGFGFDFSVPLKFVTLEGEATFKWVGGIVDHRYSDNKKGKRAFWFNAELKGKSDMINAHWIAAVVKSCVEIVHTIVKRAVTHGQRAAKNQSSSKEEASKYIGDSLQLAHEAEQMAGVIKSGSNDTNGALEKAFGTVTEDGNQVPLAQAEGGGSVGIALERKDGEWGLSITVRTFKGMSMEVPGIFEGSVESSKRMLTITLLPSFDFQL